MRPTKRRWSQRCVIIIHAKSRHMMKRTGAYQLITLLAVISSVAHCTLIRLVIAALDVSAGGKTPVNGDEGMAPPGISQACYPSTAYRNNQNQGMKPRLMIMSDKPASRFIAQRRPATRCGRPPYSAQPQCQQKRLTAWRSLGRCVIGFRYSKLAMIRSEALALMGGRNIGSEATFILAESPRLTVPARARSPLGLASNTAPLESVATAESQPDHVVSVTY